MLTEMHHVPDELYSARIEQLADVLDGPTLIHLEGINKQPLFICTLLHGNETTGYYAMQRILDKYRETDLPRSVSYFIGNVDAAIANARHLEDQDDYNRIWPGTRHDDSAEKDMMQTVTHIMEQKKPFASIDIHNNTSKNPHYACINILNPHGLELASHFSDIAVYFTSPKGVQSAAFSDFCPSIVLECGQSSELTGIDHAASFIDKVLHMEVLGNESGEIKLYHTVARVTLPRTVSITQTRDDSSADLWLNPELESKNFEQIMPGTLFAVKHSGKDNVLTVTSESNEDVCHEYIENNNGELHLKKPVTLSMFTTNETAIRQDCICYLMEEIHIG